MRWRRPNVTSRFPPSASRRAVADCVLPSHHFDKGKGKWIEDEESNIAESDGSETTETSTRGSDLR